MLRLRLLLASLLQLLPFSTSAAPVRMDMVEHIFGATGIHAVTGQGRLAVGVAQDGDLTTLVWPNPSCCDQLGFLTSNALDARSLSRFGALPGSALYLGLLIEQANQSKRVVWLHDPTEFSVVQDYGAGDGAAIETHFTSVKTKGLTVTIKDDVVAHGQGDVLVRQVNFELTTAEFKVLSLQTYANLSPVPHNSRLPELPLVDWGLDGRNDFAAIWDESHHCIVHFHPQDQLIYAQLLDIFGADVSYGPIGAALLQGTPTPAETAKLAANLDSDYKQGAYIVLTTWPPPSSHHIGYDRADFCGFVDKLLNNAAALPKLFPGFTLPLDPSVLDALRCKADHQFPDVEQGWKHKAVSAAEAITSTEPLPNSDIAAGEVDEALVTPVAFTGQSSQAFVIIALGPTSLGARDALSHWASASDSNEWLKAWLKPLQLPTSLSPQIQKVARRGLINLRVGNDSATGAVVASIARQPPYGLDWPRDGAFFDVALDVSGQSPLVDKRLDQVVKWQRKDPVKPVGLIDTPPPIDPRTGKAEFYPAGAWEMNSYADGMPGGNVRFEIDNTAFNLWTLCAHAGWTSVESAGKRWDAIQKAANLLADWKDPKNGLQALASEDDNATFTQTLHGAVTVQGSLELASQFAKASAHAEEAARWHARALELQTAIATHLFDAKTGLFTAGDNAASNPGSQGSGPTAWLVWPMRVFPWTDPRVDAQLKADLTGVQTIIALTDPEGGAYFLKNLLALAMARGQDPLWRPAILAALENVAARSTQGTNHFGEVMVPVNGQADQRVATPHLWEGTLFYLTAMALHDPTALQREVALLNRPTATPTGEAEPAAAGGEAKSSCSMQLHGQTSALALIFLCGIFALARRYS